MKTKHNESVPCDGMVATQLRQFAFPDTSASGLQGSLPNPPGFPVQLRVHAESPLGDIVLAEANGALMLVCLAPWPVTYQFPNGELVCCREDDVCGFLAFGPQGEPRVRLYTPTDLDPEPMKEWVAAWWAGRPEAEREDLRLRWRSPGSNPEEYLRALTQR